MRRKKGLKGQELRKRDMLQRINMGKRRSGNQDNPGFFGLQITANVGTIIFCNEGNFKGALPLFRILGLPKFRKIEAPKIPTGLPKFRIF